MFKVVVVTDMQDQTLLTTNLQKLANIEVLKIISPHEIDLNQIVLARADFIITTSDAILSLQRKSTQVKRQHIKAVTHQGIRLVPIDNVFYFHAEHKYVTVVHEGGSLLIEDSLNSLEQEFNDLFVRIHRATLVAVQKIAQLYKDDSGHYFVRLHGVDKPLMVSRRRVSRIRSILL